MKHLLSIIIAAMTLAFTSCTNDGDIGVFYGQWKMESMTIDGKETDIDLELYYWRFQSQIIQITQVDYDTNDYVNSNGTWQEDGDYLILNFTHTSSSHPEGGIAYSPPEELGIPANAITELHINKSSSKRLVLQFTNDDGQTLIYTLRKNN